MYAATRGSLEHLLLLLGECGHVHGTQRLCVVGKLSPLLLVPSCLRKGCECRQPT
jgi:hypothetical protein